jgi:hypothetical protein
VKIRLAASIAVVTALAAPAAAQAAFVKTDRACYAPFEQINVTGGGFAPNGSVAISQDGQQRIVGTTDAAGGFGVFCPAPNIGSGERASTFTATDQANLALTASTVTKLTAFTVSGSLSGRPEKKKHLKIRGFTRATTIYAHVKKGRKVRNFRLGHPKAPCGTLNVRKRFFPRNNVRSGLWKVQIDGKRKYSSKTIPSLTKQVFIYKVFKVSSSSRFETPWTSQL